MKIMRSSWSLFVTLLILCAIGCQSKKEQAPVPTLGHAEGGGVDVGNMNAIRVLGTHLVVTPPENWRQTISKDALVFEGPAGSRVQFSQSDLTDVTSPNAESLKLILDAREPKDAHEIVRFNGLEGVRTEWSGAGGARRVRLYLMSELSDFVKVEMDFVNVKGEVEEGENLAGSARLLYKGVAVRGSSPKTVPISDIAGGAFSFLGDCIGYQRAGCRGVYTTISESANGKEFELEIGTAGADTGRIVELGPETDAPFDQIRIEGPYLVSPGSQTRLEDIYARFSPDIRVPERSSMHVRPGYVYLVRTISWPEEDLITKIRIESRNGFSFLTYEKLVSVPEAELQRQIDAINQNTRTVDVPKTQGEVVLFNRSVYGSYFYAGFNFEFGTSGNHFITNNHWDLHYAGGYTGLQSSHLAGELSDIVDLGEGRSLESLSREGLPDFNDWKAGAKPNQALKNHTYLVWHLTYEQRLIVGAVKVVDIAADQSWIRIEWRRISVEKAPRFQRWIEIGGNGDLKIVTLRYQADSGLVHDSQIFNMLGVQGGYPIDNAIIWSGGLYKDTRPFEGENGFFQMPEGTRLTSIDATSIEELSGQFKPGVNEPKAGQVFAFKSENYFYKVLGVIEIRAVRGSEIELGVRVLSRARTPYAWPVR